MADDVIERFTGICIIFALRREAAPFLRQCKKRQRLKTSPVPAWVVESPSRIPLLILVAGIGSSRVQQVFDSLLTNASPRLIITAGFAGGLADSLAVGSIVVPGMVVTQNRLEWPTLFADSPSRLLCSDRIIADPLQKRALFAQSEAVAVDMESATVAEHCRQRGIPFGAIKAVSDTVHTALSSRLTRLLSGGEVSPWKIAWNCLGSPRLIAECLRLARDTNRAGKNLATALVQFLASPRLGFAAG